MDVTKLFETTGDTAPLETAKLDAMIEAALAHPQIRLPANQNKPWAARALAVAAAIVIAITVSLQFMPIPSMTGASADAGDAFDEISDLVIYETMNDLS